MLRASVRFVAVWAALQGLSCSGNAPATEVSGGGSGMSAGGQANAGGSAQSGGSAAGSTVSGAASDFAAAFCRAARSCCEAGAIDSAGLADCEAEAHRQFDVLEGVARGSVLVTSELSACVAQLSALADSCVLDAQVLSACNAAFTGTVEVGGECVDAYDCKRESDAIACIIHSDGDEQASGTCRELQAAELGAPCLATVSSTPYLVTHSSVETNPPLAFCKLADGLYCSFESGTCESLAGEGEACAGTQGCRAGLVCEETCQKAKQPGDSCTSSTECLTPHRCVEGKCDVAPFASEDLCGGDLN